MQSNLDQIPFLSRVVGFTLHNELLHIKSKSVQNCEDISARSLNDYIKKAQKFLGDLLVMNLRHL
ncbi:hypothetical protein SAMN05443246_4501 [Paenibacillus sp. GP183]|nr:hypothetical protein SAMN05443246_4501 [Paenibacillus sp. GP183]